MPVLCRREKITGTLWIIHGRTFSGAAHASGCQHLAHVSGHVCAGGQTLRHWLQVLLLLSWRLACRDLTDNQSTNTHC